MRHRLMKVILTILGCLFLGMPSTAQSKQLWGFGAFGGYSLPVFGMGKQFSGSNQFGATWQYQYSPKLLLEVEYQYSQFEDNEASTRTFFWPVDKKDYASPQAVSEIKFNSVLLNLMISPKLPQYPSEKLIQYLIVGTGIYDYRFERRNFIYPGQTIEPLNTSLYLDPQIDERAALGIHVGYGGQFFFREGFALDLRVRYHLIMGDLRPMATWGFETTTMPLQMFEIRAGLKLYFSKS